MTRNGLSCQTDECQIVPSLFNRKIVSKYFHCFQRIHFYCFKCIPVYHLHIVILTFDSFLNHSFNTFVSFKCIILYLIIIILYIKCVLTSISVLSFYFNLKAQNKCHSHLFFSCAIHKVHTVEFGEKMGLLIQLDTVT